MIQRSFVLGLTGALACSGALVLCGAAQAAETQIKLVNQGADGAIMAFDPPFVKIKAGDSVKFVAADPGHMASSIEGMEPEGAKAFQGEIGKDITVKFDKEGVYGVECMPHFAMGMTALVAVGDTYPNLEAAKAAADKTNPEAKKRLDADFAKLGK